MAFADQYIQKQNLGLHYSEQHFLDDLNIAVVIPCHRESGIISVLENIERTDKPKSATHVIIIINHAVNHSDSVKEENKHTYDNLKEWIKRNRRYSYEVFMSEIDDKKAGVGYARKLGMDHAVSLFNRVDNKNGVIVSLDADAFVSDNFLTEIEAHYEKHSLSNCTLHYFEHPLFGPFDSEVYNAIALYELYLRYYKHSLAFNNFPYSVYTIGSCFSVRAEAYVMQGGMNKKQAGEDFYFIHKIIQLGRVYELNSLCVYPSSRISDRVPFGTGPELKQIIESSTPYAVYPYHSIRILNKLFSNLEFLYDNDFVDLHSLLDDLLVDYLESVDFQNTLNEIKSNTAGMESFKKRFFRWFDAFRVIKFLNYSLSVYPKLPIEAELVKYFADSGMSNTQLSIVELLNVLREKDRGKSCVRVC